MSKYSFGIDLGTTNSAISVLRGTDVTQPKILKQRNGKPTLPSCVMWTKKDGFTVGEQAYLQRWKSNVAYSTKKYMGSDAPVILTDDEGNMIELTPEEVGAEVIKELVRAANEAGFNDVQDVTITVPAYFNDIQRVATMKAGELAGLNVVAIINEPTSASLAYGLDDVESENIMVYDLGGGTFDVTILKLIKDKGEESIGMFDFGDDVTDESTTVRILSNSGDPMLGGDDIDTETLALVGKQINKTVRDLTGKRYNFFIEATDEEKEYILLYIEKQKKAQLQKGIELPMELTVKGEKVNVDVYIKEEQIVEATKSVFKRTLKMVNECIKTSPEKEFSKIVLVGGSTKSPVIKEQLKKAFPDKVLYDGLNPDESIALGASVQTGIKKGGSNMTIFDVLPLPIGVGLARVGANGTVRDGLFKQLIAKDTLLPIEVKSRYVTVIDNQTEAEVKVYQGFSRDASENTLLGVLEIKDLPKRPKGEVTFEVKLIVDNNGVLTVKVGVDGEEYVKVLERSAKDEVAQENKPKDTMKEKRIKRWTENSKEWNLTEEEQKEFDSSMSQYKEGLLNDKEMSMVVKQWSSRIRKEIDAVGKSQEKFANDMLKTMNTDFGGEETTTVLGSIDD